MTSLTFANVCPKWRLKAFVKKNSLILLTAETTSALLAEMDVYLAENALVSRHGILTDLDAIRQEEYFVKMVKLSPTLGTNFIKHICEVEHFGGFYIYFYIF